MRCGGGLWGIVCKFDMVMNCPQSGGLALCCIGWVRYGVDVTIIVTEIDR